MGKYMSRNSKNPERIDDASIPGWVRQAPNFVDVLSPDSSDNRSQILRGKLSQEFEEMHNGRTPSKADIFQTYINLYLPATTESIVAERKINSLNLKTPAFSYHKLTKEDGSSLIAAFNSAPFETIGLVYAALRYSVIKKRDRQDVKLHVYGGMRQAAAVKAASKLLCTKAAIFMPDTLSLDHQNELEWSDIEVKKVEENDINWFIDVQKAFEKQATRLGSNTPRLRIKDRAKTDSQHIFVDPFNNNWHIIGSSVVLSELLTSNPDVDHLVIPGHNWRVVHHIATVLKELYGNRIKLSLARLAIDRRDDLDKKLDPFTLSLLANEQSEKEQQEEYDAINSMGSEVVKVRPDQADKAGSDFYYQSGQRTPSLIEDSVIAAGLLSRDPGKNILALVA